MRHFAEHPPRNPKPKTQRLVLLVQIAGLLATAWMVWFASLVPRLGRQPLVGLLAEAIGYALLAWGWSAVVTFGLFLTIPRTQRGDVRGITLRTASTAVWFGPSMILLSMFSPAALAAALVLAVSTTRLLCADWNTAYQGRKLPESLAPALAIAVSLQAATVAVLMKFPLLSAAFFLLSAAMLTLLATFTGVWEDGGEMNLPRSILGVLLTVVLAGTLTLGGLTIKGGRWGWNFFASRGSGDSAAASPKRPTKLQETDPRSLNLADYPGVVLWPEVKPVTVLVAPLPALAHSNLGLTPADPLSIPFAGEYWMFKPPWVRPPPTSFFRRGTPAALFFRTTDHRPLLMQARHKLEQSIDLRCCSSIRLIVSNADAHPGTVALELVLSDARSPQPLSLGKVTVQSQPDLTKDPVQPVSETLDFAIPANATLGQFDEFIVYFHRDFVRMDRSARIAIDRFILMPRDS